MILLRATHFSVEHRLVTNIVRITRTSVPIESLRVCEEAFASVTILLDRLNRAELGMLYDSRAAPRLNSPALEGVMRRLGTRLFTGVGRVALLMATILGKHQAERLTSHEGLTAQAFLDEAEAMAYLDARPRPTP